jgi:hypothetical protein
LIKSRIKPYFYYLNHIKTENLWETALKAESFNSRWFKNHH